MGRGCAIPRYFFVPHSVKTGPGTYPSFYPIGVMWPGRENDSLPLPCTEGKTRRWIPPFYFIAMRLINLLKRSTRVNQEVKPLFKLRGNRDREELAHCVVLTMPVEEFSHVQYSALPSVEWQQRG